MYLMCKDTPVIKINTNEGEYEILTPELIPYQLRGKFREMPSELPKTKYELNQYLIAGQKNYEAIISYAASRVLPLTRENAKKIYQLFGYEQLQDEYSKAKIAFLCKSVSLQDNYWFKTQNEDIKWEDVNLRTNHLSEIVAQVALHGTSLSLTGDVCTPELNGQGAYAKAWKREHGDLWLHKTGAGQTDTESKIEVMTSKLLDKCNVNHIRYFDGLSNNRYTCKCKCMTTDNTSMLPGMDLIAYCNVNGINPDSEIMRIDSDSIYKMWIVDYLISNRDRHGMNWGYFYDANTMEIKGCHPLYDHNNAFDESLMQNPDNDYLFDRRMTMRQAAHKAMQKTDFHFTDTINRDDFMTDAQYHSFMERANELNIPIKLPYLLS